MGEATFPSTGERRISAINSKKPTFVKETSTWSPLEHWEDLASQESNVYREPSWERSHILPIEEENPRDPATFNGEYVSFYGGYLSLSCFVCGL